MQLCVEPAALLERPLVQFHGMKTDLGLFIQLLPHPAHLLRNKSVLVVSELRVSHLGNVSNLVVRVGGFHLCPLFTCRCPVWPIVTAGM